jgi:hypothetical protein
MLALWQNSVPEDWSFRIVMTLPNGSDDNLILQRERDIWSQLNGQGVELLNGLPRGRGNCKTVADSSQNHHVDPRITELQ